jgi:probable HAF family extracellular repeat protein
MMCKRWRCACIAFMVGALPVLSNAAPEYFSVSPASGKYSAAVALNDAGRYAVNSFPPDIPYAVASISGSPSSESVGSLGGNTTRIRSLNILGDAVGDSTTAAGELRPFLYSSGRILDLTARYDVLNANAINDRGEIAGRTREYRAVVLRNGTVDAFGPDNSTAIAINGRGDVLVEYFPSGVGFRTAIYSQGTLTDLPLFGGTQVVGNTINDAGWVTGYGTTAANQNHAYLYDGDTITDLTPAATNSIGYDINNLGQVVGAVDNRAFLYSDGELIDLNTLIDPQADRLLTSAIEINNRSQILARSCDRAGVFCYDAVLLTPVPAIPEPAAIGMLLMGLALLRAHQLRHAAGQGIEAQTPRAR